MWHREHSQYRYLPLSVLDGGSVLRAASDLSGASLNGRAATAGGREEATGDERDKTGAFGRKVEVGLVLERWNPALTVVSDVVMALESCLSILVTNWPTLGPMMVGTATVFAFFRSDMSSATDGDALRLFVFAVVGSSSALLELGDCATTS